MHMADALVSPAVGVTMGGVSAGLLAWSSSRVKKELPQERIPLMGVLGAFVFAAQMINFTIPATGSSGHLGGGLLLAALLGPHAAFLVIASVLIVQALFFADGGILALGCNLFNLGFFPAFVAYPLLYRPISGDRPSRGRIFAASIISAVAGLQLGSLAVVLETSLSGISELPFSTFLILMQPIHLAIGIVEGVVTAMVLLFVTRVRPDLTGLAPVAGTAWSTGRVALLFLAAALVTGGVVSWYASEHPDGLEWSIAKVTGGGEVAGNPSTFHEAAGRVQKRTSFLPDYAFPSKGAAGEGKGNDPRFGTTVSGITGGIVTLILIGLVALLLKPRRRGAAPGREIGRGVSLMVLGTALLMAAPVQAGVPLETDCASTLGTGGLEVEYAGSLTHDQEGGSTLKAHDGELSVRAGLSPRTNLSLSLPYTFREEVTGSDAVRGFGDLSVSVKHRFAESGSLYLAIATSLSMPTGETAEGRSDEAWIPGATLIATYTTGESGLHLNAGYAHFFFTDDLLDAASSNDSLTFSAAFEGRVTERLFAGVEFGTSSPREKGNGTWNSFALAGASVRVSEGIELNGGVRLGLNRNEADWTILYGITAIY